MRTECQVVRLDGDQVVSALTLKDQEGETQLECAALFSFIGADPASGWLSGCAATDKSGFVLTDLALGSEHLDGRWDSLGRSPLPFETSYPGSFRRG